MESFKKTPPEKKIIDFKKAKEAKKSAPPKEQVPFSEKTEIVSLEDEIKIRKYENRLKEIKEKIAEFEKILLEKNREYNLAVQSKEKKDIENLFEQLKNLNYNITRLKGIVYDLERDLRSLKEFIKED